MSKGLNLRELIEEIGPLLAANVETRDANDLFAEDNYDLLKHHRVFSALAPADLGGGDVSYSAMAAFLRRLAHFCPSTALALSMHQHLVAAALYNHRHGKPGANLLERVAAQEAVLVSTGANDWMESSGSATRAPGGFRVTAHKPFASGCVRGDVLVTSAPFEDPQEGRQVLHFAVPLSAQGVSRKDDWRALGMRASGSNTVALDDVFVPDDAVTLRRPCGRYHPAWNVILVVALPLIMSVYTGVAEAASILCQTRMIGRSKEPDAPYLLGEMMNQLTNAQLATDDMIRLASDLNFSPSLELSNAVLIRKSIAATSVLATAEKALEAVGGVGFYRQAGLERLLRDAHGAQFHPLATKPQHRFTGRIVLGLDPIVDGDV